MSWLSFALGISLIFTAIVLAGQIYIWWWFRKHRGKYTFLDGIDHFSKLAAGCSLILSVVALCYAAYSGETSGVAAAKMNRQSAALAEKQTALLQRSVQELQGVSSELSRNADASVEAANSLDQQLKEQTEIWSRKPKMQIALLVVDPVAGEGSLVGIIKDANFKTSHKVITAADARGLIVRIQVLNSGDGSLQTGGIQLHADALDGGEEPTFSVGKVMGMAMDNDDDGDETPDLYTNQRTLTLPISDMPPKTMKDYQFNLRFVPVDDSKRRRFRLTVDLAGDTSPYRGITDFDIRYGRQVDPRGKLALDAGRYDEAFRLAKEGADRGDMDGMSNLGLLYSRGFGVQKDCAKALYWYNRSRSLGNSMAISNLGNLYESGNCVKRDYSRAHDYYLVAANAGSSDGMQNLGHLYALGDGVKQDYGEAAIWYNRAIALNDAMGMERLGELYEYGWGLDQDYAQARNWYQKAADQGLRLAMTRLAELYRDGRGVQKDEAKAKEWTAKASGESIRH